jgi:hypothetical protein
VLPRFTSSTNVDLRVQEQCETRWCGKIFAEARWSSKRSRCFATFFAGFSQQSQALKPSAAYLFRSVFLEELRSGASQHDSRPLRALDTTGLADEAQDDGGCCLVESHIWHAQHAHAKILAELMQRAYILS